MNGNMSNGHFRSEKSTFPVNVFMTGAWRESASYNVSGVLICRNLRHFRSPVPVILNQSSHSSVLGSSQNVSGVFRQPGSSICATGGALFVVGGFVFIFLHPPFPRLRCVSPPISYNIHKCPIMLPPPVVTWLWRCSSSRSPPVCTSSTARLRAGAARARPPRWRGSLGTTELVRRVGSNTTEP